MNCQYQVIYFTIGLCRYLQKLYLRSSDTEEHSSKAFVGLVFILLWGIYSCPLYSIRQQVWVYNLLVCKLLEERDLALKSSLGQIKKKC